MSGFNICGMVVRSRDNRTDDVRASLLAIPGVEIHAAETGRMVVTVEDESYRKKRKIQASNELYHKALGTIDTREKFEAKRLQLARNEWERMKANDSRECRNRHNKNDMYYPSQGRRAVDNHIKGFDEGKTCIDCHKGIAHEIPDMIADDASAVLLKH